MTSALRDGRPTVLECDGSLEGILVAVGIGYLAHAGEGQVTLLPTGIAQPHLGDACVPCPSPTDDDVVGFAERVYRGFERKVSEGCPLRRGNRCPRGCKGSCASRLALAAAKDDPDVPEAIHRYMRLGFSVGPRIGSMLSDERVATLDGFARYTLNECEHTRQFVRFSRLSDGSFFSTFRPRADTVPLVAGYFAARMREDRFCLLDPTHLVVALHREGERRCAVSRIDRVLAEEILDHGRDLAYDERYVRAMWRRFYDGLALPGRDADQRGYDLRTSWMPKRFWEGLTELRPDSLDAGATVPRRYGGVHASN